MQLSTLRKNEQVSQEELGKLIGWCQPKLSAFERKANKGQQTLADIKKYLLALGFELEVRIWKSQNPKSVMFIDWLESDLGSTE